MVIINANKRYSQCCSGRFTIFLMDSIRPALQQHFSTEQMKEIDQNFHLQETLYLAELSKEDFNFVYKLIQEANFSNDLWKREQAILLKDMALDSRYQAI